VICRFKLNKVKIISNEETIFFIIVFPVLCSFTAQENHTSEGAKSITIAELWDHMFYLASDNVDKTVCDFFQRSCKLVYEVVMELANGNVSLRD